MKKIVILLLVILVLIGAILAIAASQASHLINKFKPDIEHAASEALKVKATLGDIEVSVLPSLKLNVREVKLASSPQESLTLNNLFIHLNLLPLLSGALEISEISLDQPSLTVIKNANGGFEVVGLPQSQTTAQTPSSQAEHKRFSADSNPSSPSSSSALKIDLQKLKVSGAKITLKDDAKSKTLVISDVNFSSGITFDGNQAKLSSLSFGANLNGTGKVQMDGELNASKDGSGEGKFNLSLNNFQPKLLQEFFTGNPGTELQQPANINSKIGISFKSGGSFELKMETNSERIITDQFEVTALMLRANIAGSPAQQNVSISPLTFKFNGEALSLKTQISLSPTRIVVKNYELDGFNGAVTGDAELQESKKLLFKANAKGLNIESLLKAATRAPARVTGVLSKLDTHIETDISAPTKSVTGDAKVLVEGGKVLDMNLAGMVLQAVNNLPFLSGNLYSQVPDSERSALDTKDTSIRSLNTNLLFQGDVLKINEMKLDSDLFLLEAEGRAAFSGDLNLNTTIYFSPGLSKAMAAKNKEVSKLFDEQQRLLIPLTITGTPPKVSVLPNLDKLIKTAGKRVIEDEAHRLIGRALGGGGKNKGSKGLGGFLKGF